MTAPAIPIASPQTGISVHSGSGISAGQGRGMQTSGGAKAARAGNTHWQHTLHQAGVGQQKSSQDPPIHAANGSSAADAQASDSAGTQAAKVAALHARVQAASVLEADAAKQPSPQATASPRENSAGTSAGSSSGAARAKTSGKSGTHPEGASAANPAQSLLASLALPANVPVAVPQANTQRGHGASTSEETAQQALSSRLDAAALLRAGALGSGSRSESGSGTGNSSAIVLPTTESAPAAGKGIAGLPPFDLAAHPEGQTVPGVLSQGFEPGTNSAANAGPSAADAALVTDSAISAQAAAQSAVQASSDNANTLARALHATVAAASAHSSGPVSADSNGKIQSTSSDSPSVGHVHAASSRDSSTAPAQTGSTGIAMAAQTVANGQTQTVTPAGHAAMNMQDVRGVSSNQASSAAGTHSADPFSSLDSGSATNARMDSLGDSATWMHAGTHTAEAGFQDPSLGWVAVRAQLSGGALQASILPATTDAAQALGGHLAGLHAYLADHHVLTGTVTMAQPEASAGWSGAGHGNGHGGGQGSNDGGNPGGDAPLYGGTSGGHAGNSQPQSGSTTLEGIGGISRAASVSTVATAHTSRPFAARGGGLISVVA